MTPFQIFFRMGVKFHLDERGVPPGHFGGQMNPVTNLVPEKRRFVILPLFKFFCMGVKLHLDEKRVTRDHFGGRISSITRVNHEISSDVI